MTLTPPGVLMGTQVQTGRPADGDRRASGDKGADQTVEPQQYGISSADTTSEFQELWAKETGARCAITLLSPVFTTSN